MPYDLFISYAHEDIKLRDELAAHLSNLRKQGLISDWFDGDICPGTEWEEQIMENLNKAQIVLLLISADYMDSEFCYRIEMKRAIARHDANQVRVIPIILRPTDWEGAPFAKLQVLPTNHEPVTNWPTHDAAFADIVKGIRKAIQNLEKASISSSTSMDTTPSSGNVVKVTFYSQVKSLTNLWVRFLSGLFGIFMAIVIFILLGFNLLPSNAPLTNIVRQHPIGSLVIGGAFASSFIIALILLSKTENPNNRGKGWHLPPWGFSAVISTINLSLIALLLTSILIHPSWCPTMICHSPQIVTEPNGIHDSNLEIYVITTQSVSWVIPGDPAYFSESNLPKSIGAVRIDEKTSTFPYRVVLGVHSLQQGHDGILFVQEGLVIKRVPPMPRPLNVWVKGLPVTYNTNPFLADYRGESAGNTFPATYVPVPFGNVQLVPGEADQLTMQVSSKVPADLQFNVQVTYRVTNEQQLHTLILPYVFEVVFSDASNWHEYRLERGHFVQSF